MDFAEAERLAAQAERRHRDGGIAEAELLYQAALRACPGHARSLHGLGCLAHQAGRADLAIGLIGQAVAAAPEVASYMISLGLALLDRGHVEEARAALRVAVLRDATDPRAHRAEAQALLRLGRLDEAEARLREAIRLEPGSAAAHLSLGGVLRARGAFEPAALALREAARLAPGDPLIWHALATLHAAAGALEAAEAAFRRTAELLPDDPAALANLGTALFGLDRLEEAEPWLRRARVLAADNAATLSGLGLVLIGLGETVEAEQVLAEACRLAPSDDAIAINHGTALAALERGGEAEAALRGVLSRVPGQKQARFNLGTLLLARGARREGWAAFEARLALGASEAPGLPRWDGAPVDAGAVLLRAEQGLGDTIQFLRWVPAAARRAALQLELPPALLRLVEGLFDPKRVRLLASGEAAQGCVAQASLLSLPALLADDTVPTLTIPSDEAVAEAWRANLPAGLRVGLVWAGSPGYRFDRSRSIPLSRLAPLGAVPGVVLVSLQQGPAATQTAPPGVRLIVPEAPFRDAAETAGLIAALDLVVSVDTMVAHLAGSLGKPVWLLDRFGGDWRWQSGFSHGSDWYPGLRRFAPATPLPAGQAWDEPIARLAAGLAKRLSRYDAPRPARP